VVKNAERPLGDEAIGIITKEIQTVIMTEVKTMMNKVQGTMDQIMINTGANKAPITTHEGKTRVYVDDKGKVIDNCRVAVGDNGEYYKKKASEGEYYKKRAPEGEHRRHCNGHLRTGTDIKKRKCRYGVECWSKHCKYLHPSEDREYYERNYEWRSPTSRYSKSRLRRERYN
jgi:hypothetical protein